MPDNRLEQAIALERQAHEFRSAEKIEDAFSAFDKAAGLYRDSGEHLKSALCYASAATCWNIRTGWLPLRNAATRNEFAARQAVKARHYDYACSLFREAALLYEKEGDYENYSNCFWHSQAAAGERAWANFLHPGKERGSFELSNQEPRKGERFRAFGAWILNVFGRLTWGYGERPFRTLILEFSIIIGSALIYRMSGLVAASSDGHPASLAESLYFSMITFTTVGFGDFLPLGWTRIFAAHEALAGIFLTPLFLVALTRRYLKMTR